MTQLIINSDASLSLTCSQLAETYLQHRYLRISVKIGKGRSKKQNSFSHAWYVEIAKAFPENDAKRWKRFCKLHYGVPILRAEDEEFKEAYDGSVKLLPYENKLIAMDSWPVTSIMTKRQLSDYATEIQAHFSKCGLYLEVKNNE
jgi:hypothetical protein